MRLVRESRCYFPLALESLCISVGTLSLVVFDVVSLSLLLDQVAGG